MIEDVMDVIILSRHEQDQLRKIGNAVYGDGKRPYWWGKKTMPKLLEKGLVEPHPNDKRGWCITDLGRAVRASYVERS